MELLTRYKGLIDFIAERYKRVVEIGIGRFPFIAYALIEKGVSLHAVDIYPVRFMGIKVVKDDIMKPDFTIYRDVQMLFSIKPPPELVPYMLNLAERISADLIVKPLSSDYLTGRLIAFKKTTFYIWEHV